METKTRKEKSEENNKYNLCEIDKLNFDLYKKSHKDFDKFKKSMFNSIIKELPREFIIETLKKKKLIKRDWEQKGEQYVERNTFMGSEE